MWNHSRRTKSNDFYFILYIEGQNYLGIEKTVGRTKPTIQHMIKRITKLLFNK